jgi:cytochrome c oxidase subunit 2
MKRLISALSATALCASLIFVATSVAAQAADPQTITITATTAFSPSQITVHAGQPVTLTFKGTSGVHGVESKDLGIPATMITPGSTKSVTFTPQKAGEYTLHCTIVCGPKHADMAIVIKVVG